MGDSMAFLAFSSLLSSCMNYELVNYEGTSVSRDLILRTKEFALRIVGAFSALPKTTEPQVLGKPALRSGTSVGALY